MSITRKLLSAYLCYWVLQTLTPSLGLASEQDTAYLQYLTNAKEYVDKGKYELAKSELETGLKLNPKSPDILNNLGSIYIHLSQSRKDPNKRLSDLSTARNYFTSALENRPDFATAWNGLADVYYLGGQTHQAITYYKKALSLSPKNAYEAQTNLANALRDTGLIQEAQDNYQKAIEINPLYAPAHNGYAELLLNKGELDKAYTEGMEAIRLKPTYATAYYHLGLIETAKGNKKTALKAYLLSLRYEKNSSYARETQNLINQLGLDSNDVTFSELRLFQSQITEPLAAPFTANEIKTPKEEKLKTSHFNSATNFTAIESAIANKQWTQANKIISALLKAHPKDPVLLNESALVMFEQKKYASAETTLKEAILRSNNRLAAAYYNLGQVYLAKHDLNKAKLYFNKAKEIALEYGENYALTENMLAIIFKQEGNLAAAQSSYFNALRQSGNNYPVIHYNLAMLLEKMNKPQEARQEFKNYINLAPNGLNVKQAQEHLGNSL